MSGGVMLPLGEICRNASRRFAPPEDGKVWFINTGDVEGGRFTHNDLSDWEGLPGQAKKAVVEGDILYSEIRPGNGRYAFVDQQYPNAVVSTKFMVIEASESILPKYLYHVITSPELQNAMKLIAESRSGTFPQITFDSIAHLELMVPSKPEQLAVSSLLDAIEGRIRNNQKMNQTLEEIAKAIFKSWFVDFDPVRAKAEGRPTGLPPEISDLFPDELVDSEIGEIPKGWDVGALSDVADITMGQSPPGDTYNDDGVGLPFYQGSTDFGFRFPSLRKYCSEPKRLADADDVLISVRAPVGDLNRAKDDCCIGRGLASLRAKNSLQTWVFYRCKFLSQQLETFNSEGTVFGSINGKDLKGLPTILAPELLCKAFDEIAKPMDDAVRNRTLEIEVLSELRDTLLPKLISGELRIPDAEKFLEEAGI